MSKVRESFDFIPGRGQVMRYVVDHEDGHEMREATFDRRSEAEDFAAELVQPESARAQDRRPSAGESDGIAAGNRAIMAAISGQGGPVDAPCTLEGVVTRITGVMLTR